MIIDGAAIAADILSRVSTQTATAKSQGVSPTLSVLLVGDDPASLAYIKQKQKAADQTGIALLFTHLPKETTRDALATILSHHAANPSIHGIILQRPVPDSISNVDDLLREIPPEKDVDGFLPDSLFDVPVALAVDHILSSLRVPLESKTFAVIGRGPTAGAPIARFLTKHGYTTTVIHQATPNKDALIQQADIVISCVGKPNVITGASIKPGAVLIGVGIWRDDEGKLHGDYEPAAIESVASWYTPTPKGVGPVNVACLMQNVIKACTLSLS